MYAFLNAALFFAVLIIDSAHILQHVHSSYFFPSYGSTVISVVARYRPLSSGGICGQHAVQVCLASIPLPAQLWLRVFLSVFLAAPPRRFPLDVEVCLRVIFARELLRLCVFDLDLDLGLDLGLDLE